MTRAAPARRSGASTCAPVSFFTPVMIAVLPSTLMRPPIRASSSTYLKRFSKILSVTTLVPSASASVTVICGCISVGNPGYGSVLISVCTWLGRPTTRTASSNSVTSQPISISFAEIASRCFGMTFCTITSPRVIAAAHINVPASIWSGMIEYSVPCSLWTPRMRITSVPAPLTLAPMLFKKFATSTTCGSFAGFSMIVSPSASVAAIMILIVAPTDTISR